MFVICVNGATYQGVVFTNFEDVRKVFEVWSGGEDMIDDDSDEVITVDELLEYGACGQAVNISNENMVEMGDDTVSVCIVELTVN